MVPLHMHSTFEGLASMRGHIYNAKKLGMEYIYITDHDFLMGENINSIEDFRFSEGKLSWIEDEDITNKKIETMFSLVLPYGFKLTAEQYETTRGRFEGNLKNVKKVEITENEAQCSIDIENGKLKITSLPCEGDKWKKSVISFKSSGYRTQHTYRTSLIRDLTVRFPFDVKNLDEDIRICFAAKGSQQLPDFENSGIKYIIGNKEIERDKNFAYIPVAVDNNGNLALKISEDAKREMPGGLDNTFLDFRMEIEVRNGKSVKCFIGDIIFDKRYSNEEAIVRQRALAKKIGEEYGVTPIVTNEITAAGQHKVSFNTKVPVIDHSNGVKSHEYAVKWVKDHGGEFSLNHPFFDWERVDMNECDKAVAIRKLADEYIEKKCWGAIMLEVGFPEGRCLFSLAQHLALWDRISSAGIFISGYGDSDNHACTTKWFDGNNFCAHIYSENPGEESFIEAMKAGNLFTGDPVFFKGDATFKTEKGEVMGSVIELEHREDEMVILEIGEIPDNCRLVWVIDGVSIHEETVSKNSTSNIRVPIDKNLNFVRAELYNADGRCIMLTNPIYFVKKGMYEIPECRRVVREGK